MKLFLNLKIYLLILWLLSLVNIPSWAQDATTPTQSSLVQLAPAAFKAEMKKQPGFILDVRTPEEFAAGHLPQAVNLNYQDANFAKNIKVLKPGNTYYVYCAVGKRSTKACEILKANGLTKVYNLAGGLNAWQQAGLQVIR
jgi:rhodanese-related sulfurtransferase